MKESAPRSSSFLSFDVEDWYQGFIYRNISGWEKYPSREEASVDHILNLLSEHGVKATFFVVGRYAHAHPDVVKRIAVSGHEIASHGYEHQPVPLLGRTGFREDVRRSLDTLEVITGSKVRGYRAASWSVTPECSWAFDELAEMGLDYDSSVFPTRFHAYGFPGAPTYPHRIVVQSGKSILEFPAQTWSLGPLKIPSAGGFYLRALPLFISLWALRQSVNRGRAGMVYLHPYDLDDEVPRLKTGFVFHIIRYHNLDKTEGYLRCLLKEFKFTPIRDYLDNPSGAITG
ncbi:MAG: polysaccharide deacetylase family protein [Ignavibacteriales bacterium]|nr:polysaccharide deacetylase family protein [Ignavibacteriales bacterium]